jgi:uncharacterized protein YegJ (DUF2314 family)
MSVVQFRSNTFFMAAYGPGDCVKVELSDERTGQSEWLWLRVERCDDDRRIVFGRLDSDPIVATSLKLGQELAVSYDVIRDVWRDGPTQ